METVRRTPQPGPSPSATGNLTDESSRRLGLAAAGGLFGALAASSCCILPLVLFSLGVGGAWLGNLAALNAYQPIFVTVAVGFLGYGFYLVYRKREATVDGGGVCTPVAPRRTVKAALWIATALVAASIAFPYVGPRLLGV